MKIKQFITSGELFPSDISDSQHLYEAAGECLDSANAWEIVGDVMFISGDGKFYVGEVEFVVSPALPSVVVDKLLEDNYAECSMCGHIEPSDELGELGNEDNVDAAGLCTACSGVSYEIDRNRAIQLAGKGTK